LRNALGRLVEAGLVFQRGVPPQANFQFKHTLVRDTAYGTYCAASAEPYTWKLV
jgi:hypothetical protein